MLICNMIQAMVDEDQFIQNSTGFVRAHELEAATAHVFKMLAFLQETLRITNDITQDQLLSAVCYYISPGMFNY